LIVPLSLTLSPRGEGTRGGSCTVWDRGNEIRPFGAWPARCWRARGGRNDDQGPCLLVGSIRQREDNRSARSFLPSPQPSPQGAREFKEGGDVADVYAYFVGAANSSANSSSPCRSNAAARCRMRVAWGESTGSRSAIWANAPMSPMSLAAVSGAVVQSIIRFNAPGIAVQFPKYRSSASLRSIKRLAGFCPFAGCGCPL